MKKKYTLHKINIFSAARLGFFIGLGLSTITLVLSIFEFYNSSRIYYSYFAGIALTMLIIQIYSITLPTLYCLFYNFIAAKFGGLQYEVSEDSSSNTEE